MENKLAGKYALRLSADGRQVASQRRGGVGLFLWGWGRGMGGGDNYGLVTVFWIGGIFEWGIRREW